MADGIKHADVLSDGLLLTLKDGREALLKHDDVIDCAEKTAAFDRVEEIRRKVEAED
jgi:hypothetical protein